MITVANIDKSTKQLIEKAYHTVLEYFSLTEDFEVFVTFVGLEKIHNLNREYRGINSPTDVLTFPNIVITLPFDPQKYISDKNPETNKFFLGDIIVSLTIAKRQAQAYNHSLIREILFLVVHGLLHLLGFDHMNKEEENNMIRHQEEILDLLGVVR